MIYILYPKGYSKKEIPVLILARGRLFRVTTPFYRCLAAVDLIRQAITCRNDITVAPGDTYWHCVQCTAHGMNSHMLPAVVSHRPTTLWWRSHIYWFPFKRFYMLIFYQNEIGLSREKFWLSNFLGGMNKKTDEYLSKQYKKLHNKFV